MFQYKTKGNVSPQGKRRVYFSCHPEDYERFFERISAEVLNITDCAVWYSTDEGYEDIDTDLGQINLLVMPVTTKLLTKPCRTMKLDVPFVLEHHIPILPLMQEGGLDELFSRNFGDLQYLDSNAREFPYHANNGDFCFPCRIFAIHKPLPKVLITFYSEYSLYSCFYRTKNMVYTQENDMTIAISKVLFSQPFYSKFAHFVI